MSIAFIEKALYYEVTPTFAKVKGQFINLKDQRSAEKKVSLSHLKDHSSRLRNCWMNIQPKQKHFVTF